jgi:hypothetical protein
MSNLGNQYISSSYQSVLNIGQNPGGELTNNLQYLTDGAGNVTPIQMSSTQVNIVGAFTVNGTPFADGSSGTSGTSGVDGSSGTSGTSGVSGSSGSSGTSGVSGVAGSSGTSGTSGDSIYQCFDNGGTCLYYTTASTVSISTDDPNNSNAVLLSQYITSGSWNNPFRYGSTLSGYGNLRLISNPGPDGTGDNVYIRAGYINPSSSIILAGNTTIVSSHNDTNPANLKVSGSINVTGQYLVNGVPFAGGSSGTSGTSGIGVAGSSGTSGTSGSSGTSPLVNTGSFATTGSNTFYGSQTIQSGDLTLNNSGSLHINGGTAYLTNVQQYGNYNVTMPDGGYWFLNGPSGSNQFMHYDVSQQYGATLNLFESNFNIIGENPSLNLFGGGNAGSGAVNSLINIFGQNPSLTLAADYNYGGSQYPNMSAIVDSVAYPQNIFAGYQVQDAGNGYFTTIGFAGNTYAPEVSGSLAGWIGGGLNNDSGSNTAIIFPSDSANMEVYKPTNFHFPVNVQNNLLVSGSIQFNNVAGTQPGGKIYQDDANGPIFITPNSNVQIDGIGTYFTGKNNDGSNTGNCGINAGQDVFGNNTAMTNGGFNAFVSGSLMVGNGGFVGNLIADYDWGATIGYALTTFNSGDGSLTANFYGPGTGYNAPYGNPDNTIFAIPATGSNVLTVYRDTEIVGTVSIDRQTNIYDNLEVSGYIKSNNSYTQLKISGNQTVTASSDTVVLFDNATVGNNGWWDTTNHRFQPPVAGTYEINFSLMIAPGTGNGQMNAQINKNGTSQLYITQDEINKNQNHTLQGSVLVELNGDTDYVQITFYTSSNSGSQDIVDTTGTLFKAILI